MKGDFSRLHAASGASVSGLWLQQGRPLLDADFNQAMELQRQTLATAIATLIGGPAGPAADLGFGVSPVCALALNDSGEPGRHCLWFPAPAAQAPTGQEVEAELFELDGEEDLVLRVSLLDTPAPQHAVPTETVHLNLTAPSGAAGPVLARPGAYLVRLRADRSVVLERPGVVEPVSLGTLPAGAWADLLVAEDHGHLYLRLGGGKLVTAQLAHGGVARGGRSRTASATGNGTASGTANGTASAAHVAAGLVIGAGDPAEVRRRDPPLLTCHVATLRRWSACLDLDRLAAKLAAGKLPRRHLAFDLDVTRISPEGADAGRMHDRREGHETHPAHAARVHAAQVPDAVGHPAVGSPAVGHPALAWSGAAPRICLERYRLSAGRYVVDGLACHVPAALDGDAQPFLPDPAAAAASDPGSHLIYLDLWERGVDALEDPSLADPALQGVDTVIRGETVWQVRSARIDPSLPAAEPIDHVRVQPHGSLAIWRSASAAPRQGNGLLRVEIHHPGWTDGKLTEAQRAALLQVTVIDRATRTVALSAGAGPAGTPELAPGAPVRFYAAANSDDAPAPGLLTQVERVVAPDQVVLAALLDPMPAGPLLLLPIASFKWSHGNAAASYPVASIQPAADDQGNPVAIALLASAGLNGFELAGGDWVELTDRATALLGRPGRFLQVRSRQEDLLQLGLDGWSDQQAFVPAADAGCRLVAWSQRRHYQIPPGEDAPPADAPWPRPVTAAAMELDPGVWIRFGADGLHRCGDYWTAPLREECLDIAGWQGAGWQGAGWQGAGEAAAAARPPQGITHHLAPLALLRVDPFQVEATDLRHAFPSLRQLAHRLPQDAADLLTELASWARAWGVTAPDRAVSPAELVERIVHLWLPKPAADVLAGLARWANAWSLPPPEASMSPQVLLDRFIRGWMQATFNDDLRLLARPGAHVEGFEPTGETVTTRASARASWHQLPHPAPRRGERGTPARGTPARGKTEGGTPERGTSERGGLPSGAGQGAMLGPLALFVGGETVWRSAAPFSRWHRAEALSATQGAAVAVYGTAVLLAGGQSPRNERAHGAVVRIDAMGLQSEHLGELAVPVSHAAAAVVGDTLYVIGGLGRDGKPVAIVQALDLARGARRRFGLRRSQGRVCGGLPTARAHHAAIAWGGMLLVAGGQDERGRASGELLLVQPETCVAMQRAALPTPCRQAGVAALADGLVLAGGLGPDDGVLAEVSLYRPQQDRWVALAPLPVAGHSFALLAEPEALHPDALNPDALHPGGARLIALGGRGAGGDHEGGHALPLQRTMTVLVPRSI